MILQDGERLEDLQCGGLKIIQNKKLYAFTSDSVVLANFIKTKKNDVCVEIGAGSGVISILVQAKNCLKKIFAFEIQKEMQNLCQKNVELNNLTEKIEVVCDDVKNFNKTIKNESVDVVFSNPPYFKKTNFEQNKVKKIAKEEVLLSFPGANHLEDEHEREAFFACWLGLAGGLSLLPAGGSCPCPGL